MSIGLASAGGVVASRCDVTILMPCLDEAETLGGCIDQALAYLRRAGVDGEVLVADNGSTDGSRDIARRHGARVVCVPQRGYGAALRAGVEQAYGPLVVMGDADGSYDFANLDEMIRLLRAGADVVVGNRFRGGVLPGAMPPLHRYLGTPVLSALGRWLFDAPIGDFHCGLRGVRRSRMLELDLQTTGMEFASEMIAKARLAGHVLAETPTVLRPDGRSRAPHLRTWVDGWRHLRFLFRHMPAWALIYPALLVTVVGAAVLAIVSVHGASSVSEGQAVLLSALAVVGYALACICVIARAAAGIGPADLARSPASRCAGAVSSRLFGVLLAISGSAGMWWVGIGSSPNSASVRDITALSITALALSALSLGVGFFRPYVERLSVARRSEAP